MDSAAAKVCILIIDDHALFRQSVSRLLGAEPDLDVVADCASVAQGLQIIATSHVDLVLLDYDLGRQKGIDFLNEARRSGFDGKVLIVTAGLSEVEAAELINEGIAGIFMKHSSAAALSQSIRQVMEGATWFDQQYLRTIFDVSLAVVRETKGRTKRLTERERSVLRHILEGLTNKEIAGRLGISESSVKASIQQLFDKSGVRTRSQLVRIAIEQYRDQL
jgi:two-component system nitrate/nitrite response regulator NarL